MEYEESFKYEDWKNERGWADLIIGKVHELNLPFRLDKLTRGRGDCFLITILQQLRRPELKWRVNPSLQRLAQDMEHMGLRVAVKNYIMTSRHPKVAIMKAEYEAGAGWADKISWSVFWSRMLEKRREVDAVFV